MARRFIAMRHAKSAWDDPELSDHDRPLNARGRRAADAMGLWLAERGLIPDAVILSSATRVTETWRRISAPWPSRPPALGDRGLYMAWPARVIETLREVDPDAGTVLLINHEPTISALVEVLAAPPIDADAARAFLHYPTAAVSVLAYDGPWTEAGPGTMRFETFQIPKEL
ncbi:MAG: histidine phosphatase family protein [Pseudomonadota bacterium]